MNIRIVVYFDFNMQYYLQFQKKFDDIEMALFDLDSDGEDVQEVYFCVRVDVYYYRGYVIYRKRNVLGFKEYLLDEFIFK